MTPGGRRSSHMTEHRGAAGRLRRQSTRLYVSSDLQVGFLWALAVPGKMLEHEDALEQGGVIALSRSIRTDGPRLRLNAASATGTSHFPRWRVLT